MDSDRETARDVARNALVSSLIVYGVQAAILLGVGVVLSRRYWLEHARWRYNRWRSREQREWEAARAEVRRDISRLEHGESMPAGGPGEAGMYGGL